MQQNYLFTLYGQYIVWNIKLSSYGMDSCNILYVFLQNAGSHVSLTQIGDSTANLDRLSTLAEETPSRFASSFSRQNPIDKST